MQARQLSAASRAEKYASWGVIPCPLADVPADAVDARGLTRREDQVARLSCRRYVPTGVGGLGSDNPAPPIALPHS